MEEAWLSGAIENVPRELMPAAHALIQAERDIETAVKDLTDEQVWFQPPNSPSVGFHLRHIAGSLDRLLTYARDGSLSDAQHEFLKREPEPGTPPESTASLVSQTLARIDEAVRFCAAHQSRLCTMRASSDASDLKPMSSACCFTLPNTRNATPGKSSRRRS